MTKKKYEIDAGTYKIEKQEFELGLSFWKEYRGSSLSQYILSLAIYRYIFTIRLSITRGVK